MTQSSQSKSLAGQAAIVSGALGDIGRAIALALAQQGAHVALGDVKGPAEAEPFLKEVRGAGVKARYDRVDVADAEAVAAWVRAAAKDFGAPALIVPNAAIVTLADFRAVTPEQFARELDVNLHGAFHLAHAGVKELLAAKKPGRVVFVGSWAGQRPHVHIPTYCVAKAGLRMLSQCMALELAPFDILVNEVAPGYVDAGLSAMLWKKDPPAREKARRNVPTRQLIDPAEVAAAVAWLCDPANRHVTGQSLVLDGGLSLTSVTTKKEGEA